MASTIKIVCVSDTHNDDCASKIPDGDIFIHAGDMTDFGTLEELQKAYNWIISLPHRTKIVVAGNHDFGLDSNHPGFLPETVELFTSDAARAAGINYINRNVQTFTNYTANSANEPELRVYGNPCQPEFIGKPYAFIYRPYPSDTSTKAWETAPTHDDNVHIWVMHSPPLNRLDSINKKYKELGLTGCEVQAKKIATAKPLLCVFGHYHFSRGVERVKWEKDGDGIEKSEILSMSAERQLEEGGTGPASVSEFDFTDLEVGRETIFVNAAWKTMDKTPGAATNDPIIITLTL
ncbi:uncharacterized protein DFL_005332 [Arthrobotrys flagrans]|uniref:Calcineurin-like phosphoesterase domain-containing protein n=1 Tax=Arthrobotrys flagrans TaxID=97331 RepID=A0A437A7B6_ARTFL|nr:hypothetical protein DFL_005332 [Arthrobotrys flagrans]